LLHPLEHIIGFVLVGLRLLAEAGAASEVARAVTEAIGEVAVAGMVEVDVKEPKHISTGLARMSAMLARKMTLDVATMLHREFPIPLPGAPTVRE
jgi:hypothetical protein